MRRNWYAAVLLVILAFILYVAGIYMTRTTERLYQDLQTAYSYAESEHYTQAEQAFKNISEQAETYSRVWILLIRRSLVDQLNQTLAAIPSYVSEDNLADLAVETARASTQVDQIRKSFFSWF